MARLAILQVRNLAASEDGKPKVSQVASGD
jgi:hypothetical protein